MSVLAKDPEENTPHMDWSPLTDLLGWTMWVGVVGVLFSLIFVGTNLARARRGEETIEVGKEFYAIVFGSVLMTVAGGITRLMA